MDRLVERVSLAAFAVSFAISFYVFTVVQILQSYPFSHSGAYGNQPFLFLTYSEVLEVAGPVSIVAFALWQYERSTLKAREVTLAHAVGKTFLVFGSVVAAVVYTEIHLVWGELWYGVHVWPSLPGGGGYPWGDEQVAYNLCFVKEPTFAQQTPNCSFLNYNWLLGIALVAFVVGVLIEYYFHSTPSEAMSAKGAPRTSSGTMAALPTGGKSVCGVFEIPALVGSLTGPAEP